MAWQRDIIWSRLDEHGQERCVFACDPTLCAVEGLGAAAIDGFGLIFEYRVELAPDWRLRHAFAVAHLGVEEYRVTFERRDDGAWSIDGKRRPEFDSCTDLDFAFSPSTNTMAIGRLGLGVGEEGFSRALWVREPELSLSVLEQTYRRTGRNRYQYSSGDFAATIDVDEQGLVTRYPGLFEAALSPAVQGVRRRR